MRSAYKITDPATVKAYTDAEQSLVDWFARSKAFTDTLANVVGVTRRGGFSNEVSGLILILDNDTKDVLPDGFRYVKTRGTVEPKLHKAGEYARELYEPFKDTPHQPLHVLMDAKVPSFVFDEHHTGVYAVNHFHHDGTVYVAYGRALSDLDLERAPVLTPILESEYVLAREARTGVTA